MSKSTGIPGNPPWPESSRFNSTIDFDAVLPSHTIDEDASPSANITVNCQASFLNGTLPAGPVSCTGGPSDETIQFSMKPYTRPGEDVPPEFSYVLHMLRYKTASQP